MTSTTPEALWSDPVVDRLHPAAVVCRDLRDGEALHGLDLVVPVGWRLLVASRPQMAGSRLLGVLAGLIPRRGGSVGLAGLDADVAGRAGGRVAYVGPRTAIYTWMSPREALELAARLASVPPGGRIDEALAAYGLRAVADRPMRRVGAHVAERTALAAAMLTDPEVLLLDEPLPSIGADERAALLRVPGPRRTVLLASRYPAREAGICDHVALVREGRLALRAPLGALDAAGLPLSLSGLEALADRPSARGAGRR